MLYAERLREVLSYDPLTGDFRWNHDGSVAGKASPGDYYRITVDGIQYLGHRLAFLFMTGKWPRGLIDHADTDIVNNRWLNLRLATRAQNAVNASTPKSNTSGVKGVYLHKESGRWYAQIFINSKAKRLGYFTTKEEAAEVRQLAADMLYGEFARHG